MDKIETLLALSALAHETRLDVFRLLVSADENGLAAGEIAERLGVVQNTMSSHLANLVQAGLIRRERQSRTLIYHAEVSAMQELLAFLMTDCCGGRPELCGPAIGSLTNSSTPTKSRDDQHDIING